MSQNKILCLHKIYSLSHFVRAIMNVLTRKINIGNQGYPSNHTRLHGSEALRVWFWGKFGKVYKTVLKGASLMIILWELRRVERGR